MASLREHPLDPELARIEAPTAILAAADDQHCPPRASQIIAERVVGSELTVLDDTGHPIPVERPREAAAVITGLANRAQ
jgi:3-oxoadipate enol-lactonase